MKYRSRQLCYMIITATLSASLVCCTAATDWKPATHVPESRDQTFRECRYDASKATASYGDIDAAESWGAVLVDGIAESFGRQLREDGLVRECMRVRGYES